MTAMNTIKLPLDERNLAHVLTALALAGIADAEEAAHPESRCWWQDGFMLEIPLTQRELFTKAHAFVKSMDWIPGIGVNDKRQITASPHHGLFIVNGFSGHNPLLDYKTQGETSSIFKTFSGQQSPSSPLSKQKVALKNVDEVENWLSHEGRGVASWKFDANVSSHAYDLGYGSNDDQSGDHDPFYPAIELLSIAGACFFSAPQSWHSDDASLVYEVWLTFLPLSLAPLAVAGLATGIESRKYSLATRGNTYGKGGAYRHFPRSNPVQTSSQTKTRI